MGITQADRDMMAQALQLARRAQADGEVPVGAVVARGGEIIGRGRNRSIAQHDPSAHAEILALRDAAARIGNHRLCGASVYVTLEPCIMCAGALLHARVELLVFAAHDPRFGAAGGALNLLDSPFANHRCKITAGVEETRARELLAGFFAARRG
ncbi:MAG: tRNA adenosine(34) deaminase TadA [Gammaproteobacteria bacterium]